MLLKTLAGIGLFALLGGAVGYSQILCLDGGCSITGTPYGGAFFGGMLGMAVMTGLDSPTAPANKTEEQGDDPKD